MSTGLLIALICALAGIAYGVISIFSVLSKPMGNDKMVEIANAVQEGAIAYLARQYTTIGMVGGVLFIAMGFALGWHSAIGFAIGAILSGLAGYIGMHVSVALTHVQQKRLKMVLTLLYKLHLKVALSRVC